MIYQIIKDSIRYWGSLVSAKLVLVLASAIVSARILGPKDYGLWIALSLILMYGASLHFGIGNALTKEISFYRGKKDFNRVEEIKNVAFSSIFIISVIAAIVLLFLSVIFAHKYEKNILHAIRIIALILIMQQIYDYLRRYFIGINNFKAVSEMKVYSALLTSVFTIPFVLVFKFIGIPMALAFSYLLVSVYMFNKYNMNMTLQINIKRSLSLIKIGLPIMLAGLVYNLFISVERLLIVRFFGRLNLGYYGLACVVSDFFALFSRALSGIVFVNMSERYGAKSNVEKLKELIYIPTVLLTYILSALSASVYIFLPFAVKVLLSHYAPGIHLALLAIIGFIFLQLSFIASEFLIATNRQVRYFFFLLSALILKIIISSIFIINKNGIDKVVMGINTVYFLFSNFMLIYSFLYFKERVSKLFNYIVNVYKPILYVTLILYLLNFYMESTALITLNKLNHVLFLFLIFIIFIVLPLGYSFKVFLSREKLIV